MRLFRPSCAELTLDDVQRYLLNFLEEWQAFPLNSAERAVLSDVKILGRLLNPRTRGFFLYHFCQPVRRAVDAFFAVNSHPRVLELGCGSGSISLLFALIGAEVIGVDLDPVMISACRRRQLFYEGQYGRLPVTFVEADAFEFLSEDSRSFDAIHLLFSFNTIQPSTRLLNLISGVLAPGGRLVITDGSQQGLVNRLLRRRDVLAPMQLRAELAGCGLDLADFYFGCITAPFLFPLLPGNLWRNAESSLAAMRLLPWIASSYTVVARRASHFEDSVPCAVRFEPKIDVLD